MAINKNAFQRYQVLDSCFRNFGKKYFINDLITSIDAVLLELDANSNGISRRQIFEDIVFMESPQGWNIELDRLKDGRKVYYRYSDANFSINNMPLNELEISHLQSAADILSQFKGMPQFEWINELLPKLKQGIEKEKTNDIIIDFDNNQYLKGIEHLGSLYNAVFFRKVLSIQYQPFENEVPETFVVHPYFLKQYNNRWFLFGYNPAKEKYDWNMALDRIKLITEIQGVYQENTSIFWKDYFDDIIGVTKPIDKSIEEVVLHFYGKTGKYMETKPIHGSQKSKWLDENTIQIKLSVIINYELERLILSYADSVIVIKPSHLVTQIKQRLTNASSNYMK
jgi:predicted DNA-binding transcriptional regulator YafY